MLFSQDFRGVGTNRELTTTGLETTLELLRDIERADRNILIQDFGVPARAIKSALQEQPPGLTIRVDRDWLPRSLRRDPKTLTEIMTQLCTSTRAAIDRLLPSLSHGLGMRYLPASATVEIGVGPDTNPIYPHIITGTVKELRLTEAGERRLREGSRWGAL